MTWQRLTLCIPATELPLIESLLNLAGAAAILLSDDSDTDILEPDPGTTPLWPELSVNALFDDSLDLSGLLSVLDDFAVSSHHVEQLDDDELARAAAQTVEPVAIGPRLALVPADDAFVPDQRSLGLHMGLAFGTGRHPTTRLCLEWLESSNLNNLRVLDFGCGSGVLALAALRLGASHATAIDNEPQALQATGRNAQLNQLQAQITVGGPDLTLAGPYDLLLANILARPLLDLAATFAGLQNSGGRVVLSGLLESQLDEIENHYSQWYDAFRREVRDGWGLLTATRTNRL